MNISKGEMLRVIDETIGEYRWPLQNPMYYSEDRHQEIIKEHEAWQAIRALIEKVGEWKKQSGLILSIHSTLTEDAKDYLILSIRDFGEEGK